MKVSLFVTCLIDHLYPRVGQSAFEVLTRLGCEVEFDRRQTCCGQPAFNAGFRDEARRVGSHFLKVFEDKELIVVPSGSCATMIKVFLPALYEADSAERTIAEEVASRTWEFTDFLVTVLKVLDAGAIFREAVTYHDSCHLLRELRIEEQPRKLIRAVEGIDFREMDPPDRCCGFGGTFSVKFPEVSGAMTEAKVSSIEKTGASFVVGADVSCLMNIRGLMKKRGLPIKELHIAELLAKTG